MTGPRSHRQAGAEQGLEPRACVLPGKGRRPTQATTRKEGGKSDQDPGNQLHVGLVPQGMGCGRHCGQVQRCNCHNQPGRLQAQQGQVMRLRSPAPRGISDCTQLQGTDTLLNTSLSSYCNPDVQLDVNQWGGHQDTPNTHTYTHSIPPSIEGVWAHLSKEREVKNSRLPENLL